MAQIRLQWVNLRGADTPAKEFGPFSDLVTRWQARAASGTLPTWSSFDIRDLRPWLGRVLLAEMRKNTPYCRLFGTDLTTLFGGDFTAQPVARAFGPRYRRLTAKSFPRHLQQVLASASIGESGFECFHEGDVLEVLAVSLPLAHPGKPPHTLTTFAVTRGTWPAVTRAGLGAP